MRPGLIAAWAWTGLIVVGAIAVGVSVGARDGSSVDVLAMPVVGVIYAFLGLLVVVRSPGNSVAWLFFVVATWIVQSGATVLVLGDGTVPPDQPSMWHVIALVWDNSGYFIGLFVPVFLFFYIFPTGRFSTRRWAWAGWAGVVLVCMAPLDAALQRNIGDADQGWTISNPIGRLDANSPILGGASALGLLLLVVGGALAIITRYRRSETAVRSQIKWVLFGLGVMMAGFFGSFLLPERAPDWLYDVVFMVVLIAIPASVMVAITRYRLYDIDRLVSRTVGYLIVVSLVGLVYVAGAVWLPSRLIGEQSPVFVAASTLAGAGLFNPLRKRVLKLVDRRFNRSNYNAEQLVARFGDLIGGQTEITGLIDDTTSLVAEAVQPISIGIWVSRDDTNTGHDRYR